MQILSIDVGGTFIKYAVVEKNEDDSIKFLEHGKHRNAANEEHPDSKTILHGIAKFANEMHKKWPDLVAVCSTFGGPINTIEGTTFTIHQKYSNHGGINLKQEFAKHCPLPFHVINDVRAGALGELKYGVLKDKKNVNAVFLPIGTGICAALIIDSKIYSGDMYMAGECGPMVVNNHYFENHYAVPSIISRCQTIDKSIVTAEDCLKKAKKNKEIKNIIDGWFVGLVDAVSTIVYLLNPKYFIFGGQIVEDDYFSLTTFKQLMIKNSRQPVLNCIQDVKLVKAELGNKAALYGAASLAWTKE